MDENPLYILKPLYKSDNSIINQAFYIANDIKLAMLKNKNFVDIMLKNEVLDDSNLSILTDNGFDVSYSWISSNLPIDGKIYSIVTGYKISWY